MTRRVARRAGGGRRGGGGGPATGAVDVARFDELARLRAENRELLARASRLTAERDFLKKCASYFASPASGGSR